MGHVDVTGASGMGKKIMFGSRDDLAKKVTNR
jgi:hypothetical protein